MIRTRPAAPIGRTGQPAHRFTLICGAASALLLVAPAASQAATPTCPRQHQAGQAIQSRGLSQQPPACQSLLLAQASANPEGRRPGAAGGLPLNPTVSSPVCTYDPPSNQAGGSGTRKSRDFRRLETPDQTRLPEARQPKTAESSEPRSSAAADTRVPAAAETAAPAIPAPVVPAAPGYQEVIRGLW